MVTTDNGANIDFMDTDESITPQHYAFLVSESEFDEIFGRIRDRKLTYWADPGQTKANEINRHDGDVVSTSRTPKATFWRSSRDRMAAAAGTHELGALPVQARFEFPRPALVDFQNLMQVRPVRRTRPAKSPAAAEELRARSSHGKRL